MKLADTAPAFQDKVRAAAERSGKTPAEVHALWKEYCQTCSNFDQSPIWMEFEQWYSDALTA